MTLEMKMQDIRQEGKTEGFYEGRHTGKLEGFMETARNLLKINMPLEQIADITTLSLEQLNELQEEMYAGKV